MKSPKDNREAIFPTDLSVPVNRNRQKEISGEGLFHLLFIVQ